MCNVCYTCFAFCRVRQQLYSIMCGLHVDGSTQVRPHEPDVTSYVVGLSDVPSMNWTKYVTKQELSVVLLLIWFKATASQMTHHINKLGFAF